MRLAFATGALSAAIVAAVLVAVLIWIVTVFAGASGAWAWAPPIIAGLAALFGVATYLAERAVHRRERARMRSIGEPWAFRDD
jgi:hypothetical protein